MNLLGFLSGFIAGIATVVILVMYTMKKMIDLADKRRREED